MTWTRSSSFSGIQFSPNHSQLVSLRRSYSENNHTTNHLELWEIMTGNCLASMEVDEPFDNVSFGADGTSVILASRDLAKMIWRIIPSPASNQSSSICDNTLPLQFTPNHDTSQPISPDVPLRRHHHQKRNAWILDEQGRRVCWVGPDLRYATSDYNGEKVAFGTWAGRVPILDFSGVQY